jgi:hypothetical protein
MRWLTLRFGIGNSAVAALLAVLPIFTVVDGVRFAGAAAARKPVPTLGVAVTRRPGPAQ